MKYAMRSAKASPEQEQDAPKGNRSEVDPAEVAALLEDISCCLADAEAVAESVKDDETLAEEAFDALMERYYDGKVSRSEMQDEGTVLKARFAHTQYVQRERCCSCGCPWND